MTLTVEILNEKHHRTIYHIDIILCVIFNSTYSRLQNNYQYDIDFMILTISIKDKYRTTDSLTNSSRNLHQCTHSQQYMIIFHCFYKFIIFFILTVFKPKTYKTYNVQIFKNIFTIC